MNVHNIDRHVKHMYTDYREVISFVVQTEQLYALYGADLHRIQF